MTVPLIYPRPSVRDFTFQSFGKLNYVSEIIFSITQNVSIKSDADEDLRDPQTNCINFTCTQKEQWGKTFPYSHCNKCIL